MVFSVYYLGRMVVNINVLLLNEASLNVTSLFIVSFMQLPNLVTCRYCYFRGILFGMEHTTYSFADIDAAMASFQVFVNMSYFLNFRFVLLWFRLADCIEGSCSSNIVIFNNYLFFNFPFLNFELCFCCYVLWNMIG